MPADQRKQRLLGRWVGEIYGCSMKERGGEVEIMSVVAAILVYPYARLCVGQDASWML